MYSYRKVITKVLLQSWALKLQKMNKPENYKWLKVPCDKQNYSHSAGGPFWHTRMLQTYRTSSPPGQHWPCLCLLWLGQVAIEPHHFHSL